MAQGRFIAYYRVSTAKQGHSGLGLEAQHFAVVQYLNGGQWSLTAEFTEVESGKHTANRPELARAMAECRMTGATLVIAKLDRLSRDAAFLIGLEQAGVSFVCADMPHANRLTVGVMALVAQQEREAISRRTKEALAASRARGTKLGGWRHGPKVDGKLGGVARARMADAFAAQVGPIATAMRDEGKSLRVIAAELAARGIRTPRDAEWTATAVRNMLNRLQD